MAMDPLAFELNRLFLLGPAHGVEPAALLAADGRVRALVLELGRPADWAQLAPVWRGVQQDWGWPAPAIAISGVDAYQLWFALAEPLPWPQAQALLQALRQRYVAGVPPQRLRLWPQAPVTQGGPLQHAALVPAQQGQAEQWSAFVAPDLAAVFADSPWLDLPPSVAAQAEVLHALRPVSAALVQAVLDAAQTPALAVPAAAPHTAEQAARSDAAPRQFLLQVMHDTEVAMALRIEAAKALLPYTEPRP